MELQPVRRVYMPRPGRVLANAEDIAIPQCVGSVEETIAILHANREEWLHEQAARAEPSRATERRSSESKE